MSGIYIPDMAMPENCFKCGWGQRYGAVGDCYCSLLKDYFTNNVKPPYKERPDACPFVYVPEHGRLIDADAVDTTYSDPEVIETLETAPTIIPADHFRDAAKMVSEDQT